MLFVYKDSAGRLEIRMDTKMYLFLQSALPKNTLNTGEDFPLTSVAFILIYEIVYPPTALKTLRH